MAPFRTVGLACIDSRLRTVTLVACTATMLQAQPSHRGLGPAIGALDHEFTRIASVRELRDGRVLVSDDGENRLYVVDLVRGDVSSIGSVGEGPGEYARVGRLIALPADSTILLDPGSGSRWLLLSGARIVATVVAPDSAVVATRTALYGADRSGHVLAVRSARRVREPNGAQREESAFLRVTRSTGQADTVSRGRGRETLLRESGTPSNRQRAVYWVVYAVPEPALMFSDGWIAVARQDPYRIEWISDRGQVTTGPAVLWVSPQVTEAEKRAWQSRAEVRLGKPLTFGTDLIPWADVVPPYGEDPLLALPDGTLLVAKAEWSGSNGTEYELFDRRGVRTATLRLAGTEHIVGFGAARVYVATRDDDGIERLRVHAWP